VPAQPAQVDSLEDIPQEYRDNWNLMSIKASNALTEQQRTAMKDHYMKKANDKEYREACDQ